MTKIRFFKFSQHFLDACRLENYSFLLYYTAHVRFCNQSKFLFDQCMWPLTFELSHQITEAWLGYRLQHYWKLRKNERDRVKPNLMLSLHWTLSDGNLFGADGKCLELKYHILITIHTKLTWPASNCPTPTCSLYQTTIWTTSSPNHPSVASHRHMHR